MGLCDPSLKTLPVSLSIHLLSSETVSFGLVFSRLWQFLSGSLTHLLSRGSHSEWNPGNEKQNDLGELPVEDLNQVKKKSLHRVEVSLLISLIILLILPVYLPPFTKRFTVRPVR